MIVVFIIQNYLFLNLIKNFNKNHKRRLERIVCLRYKVSEVDKVIKNLVI